MHSGREVSQVKVQASAVASQVSMVQSSLSSQLRGAAGASQPNSGSHTQVPSQKVPMPAHSASLLQDIGVKQPAVGLHRSPAASLQSSLSGVLLQVRSAEQESMVHAMLSSHSLEALQPAGATQPMSSMQTSPAVVQRSLTGV